MKATEPYKRRRRGMQGRLAVALLLVLATRVEACTIDALVSSGSFLVGTARLFPAGEGCKFGIVPLLVSTNATIVGDASGAGSLDTEFVSDGLRVAGGQLQLQSLRLQNMRVEVSPFLSLPAFTAARVIVASVTIVTDCHTLRLLTESSASSGFAKGPGFLYIQAYNTLDLSYSAVNITCALPVIKQIGGVETVTVGDSVELLNAITASQLPLAAGGSSGLLTIVASSNITILTAAWSWSQPVAVRRNVTVRGGVEGVLNVLDFQGVVSAISIESSAMVFIENFQLVNLGPLRGLLTDYGMLPLFSIPAWFFIRASRDPNFPSITVTNVTMTLPLSEYTYFTSWTLVVTTEFAAISEQAQAVKSLTPIVKLGVAPNRETINFSHLRGTGLDMFNTSLTAKTPPGFTNIVADNPNLVFTLDPVADLTQLPVYSLMDLVTVLRSMQDAPPVYGTALFMLSNITIDPAVWPAGGFNISSPLLLVGQSNLGIPTWIDFRRVPRFVNTFGCAPPMYIFVQGMIFVNLPNAMAQTQQPQPSGAAPVGSHLRAGLGDVSIYMSNIHAINTSCPVPMTYMNQSSIVITYTEFQQVYAEAAKYLGTTMTGSGVVLGSPFAFNITSVLPTGVNLLDAYGWGWLGYKVNVTYRFPMGVAELYNNTYSPPAAVIPPGGASSDDSHLQGWEVALIVIGCVLGVALIAGLIAWRVVSRLQHEVEAVKSGISDKKSSTVSGEDTHTTNGHATHLGSSQMGGGSQQGPPSGIQASPAIKALQAAGNTGTSDDSSTPHIDRPPLEVLNNMMASLTQELDDRHLTILEVIGQGGFGVVYRGQWKGLNVAVKTITFQDRVAGGEKAQHRAILEAAISSSLAHPNVVTTYSYDIKPLTVQGAPSTDSPNSGGHAGNTNPGGGFRIVDKRTVLDWKLYLIQEFCDGGSLRTAILKRKFFDVKKGDPRMEMILDTSMELCGGMCHLHERNIIHGDLNPNNVLLKRDTQKKYGAVCKIADFGLSIKMNADQSHISNMRRGTPFYTCPQILARGNMTKAADVYSIGVMMWEMYHSCMSYRSLPNGFSARESFPNFPRRAPHDFARLVCACLESEPSQRPTFIALRAELEAQLEALKRGELRSGDEVLGPDPSGDAAHMAACQD